MFKALNKRFGKKGFTLIELIVVIAIIAILAVILIPRFTGFTNSAKAKAAMSDARNILLLIQKLEAENEITAAATDATLSIGELNTAEGTAFTGSFTTGYTLASPGGFVYQTTETYSNGNPVAVTVSGYIVQSPVVP